jgi:hypothetical protein
MIIDDTICVVHCYDLQWSIDLNETLSTIFRQPFKLKVDSWLPSRSIQLQYTAQLLKFMRSKGIKKLFFANLIEDYLPHFRDIGFAKEINGIVIGIPDQLDAYTKIDGQRKTQNWSQFVVNSTHKKFKIGQNIPIDCQTIGLPIKIAPKKKNTTNGKLFFNHRLAADKISPLFWKMPKEDFVISSPKGSTMSMQKAKKTYKNYNFSPNRATYHSLMNECEFVVSFASHETFGMSIAEAIVSGLCPIVPDDPNTVYPYLIPDELRYKSEDHFWAIYRKLKSDRKVKDDLHELTMKNYEPFLSHNWVKNLKAKL